MSHENKLIWGFKVKTSTVNLVQKHTLFLYQLERTFFQNCSKPKWNGNLNTALFKCLVVCTRLTFSWISIGRRDNSFLGKSMPGKPGMSVTSPCTVIGLAGKRSVPRPLAALTSQSRPLIIQHTNATSALRKYSGPPVSQRRTLHLSSNEMLH